MVNLKFCAVTTEFTNVKNNNHLLDTFSHSLHHDSYRTFIAVLGLILNFKNQHQ